MLGHQRLQHPDHRSVLPAPQPSLGNQLVGHDAEVVQACGFDPQDVQVGELRERRTPPLPQCLLGGMQRRPRIVALEAKLVGSPARKPAAPKAKPGA